MKKIITYMIAGLFLVSCSDKYDKDLGLYPTLTPRYISVSPTSLSFTSNASAQSLDIAAMETPWKIDNGIEWLSFSSMSGNSNALVAVSVNENTAGDEIRTGVFYVKANTNDWSYSTAISATQAGATPYINIEHSDLSMTGAASVVKQQVTANCAYSIEKSSPSDWLSVTQEGNTLTLTATANETNSHRTATIALVHRGNRIISTSFTVTQAPANITASTDPLVFENTAGSMEISVNSEANWVASTSDSWIEVSPTSGSAGTSTLSINVSPNTSTNERTGNVVLSVGGKQRIQIPIRQRGIYIETKQTELTFAATGGKNTIDVQSNTAWTVASKPEWISVDPTNGTNNGAIDVTAQDNPYTTSRTGVIRLTQTGVNVEALVNVTQNGKTFDVNTTTLNFGDKQETQTVSIETDGTWAATASNSWIKVSPTTATGSSELAIAVDENTNDNERSGSVTVTMGDKSATINVVQKGKYFTVDNSLLTYTSKGGNMDVTVTTNDSWNAKIEEGSSWLSLSATDGSGDAKLKVVASDNPSVNSRTGSVIIETVNGQRVKILVKQDARYLTVDAKELQFYYKGGKSNLVTVSTDGAFDVTTNESWLSIERNGYAFTVIAKENTTDYTRSGKITVSLTDLKEGSYTLTLLVTQLSYGGTFLRTDFGEDKDYDFTVDNEKLNFTSKGGTKSITISTKESWTAKVTDGSSWLSLSSSVGSGVGTINIIASDNPSVNGRSGNILVETSTGQRVFVVVCQEARYLTIDKKELLFYPKDESNYFVLVSTDGQYSVAAPSWLTIQKRDNGFSVNALENMGKDIRTGTIVVSLVGLKNEQYSLSIFVTQLNQGGTFIRNDYSSDKNYDISNSSNAILTIKGYGADHNYDFQNSSGITLTVIKYQTDKKWNY